MEPKPNPFAQKLVLFLSYAEIGALLVSFIGLSFFYLHFTGAREFILVGFSALAVTYFLTAFTVPPAAQDNDDGSKAVKGGFMDLFVNVVGKKIIFIGCAVCTIGLLFGFLGMNGGGQMLLIGATTTLAASLLAGIAILINNAAMTSLQGPLTRALPLGILAAYWLYTHWPLA